MRDDEHDEFSIAAAMIGGVFLIVLAVFSAAVWLGS
jgi:hypothetical protein